MVVQLEIELSAFCLLLPWISLKVRDGFVQTKVINLKLIAF